MPAFEFLGDWAGQMAATAIHAGHQVRPDLAERMILDRAVRFREEDPYTDRIAAALPSRAAIHASRFEVDLNRPRAGSVYRSPEECWGLEVWDGGALDEAAAATSRTTYDSFYAELAKRLDAMAARGPFVIFDVHSYNHRRNGANEPHLPEVENPDLNVGTGSLNRARFGLVVDTAMAALAEHGARNGTHADVRENVRFTGGHMARWAHARYPETAIVLALEYKKTFMDEWTGDLEEARIAQLTRALALTAEAVEAALEELP